MAGEILAEVVAACGELALRALFTGPVREWRLDRFVGGLDGDRRVAFFEILAAAVLHDGHISTVEEKWLEKRREAAKEDAAVVDAALATVKASLPAGSDDAAYQAFLEPRARLFEDESSREAIFKAVLVVQQAGPFAADPAPIHREALGITVERASVLLRKFSSMLG